MGKLRCSKVGMIMKSIDTTKRVSKDANLVMTKATELFIRHLTRQVLANFQIENAGSRLIKYNNILNVVKSSNKYEFLDIIIPKKITVKEYKDIMAKKKEEGSYIHNSVDISSTTFNDSDESSSECELINDV